MWTFGLTRAAGLIPDGFNSKSTVRHYQSLVGLKGQKVKKVSSNKDGGGCTCLIYQDGSGSVLVNSI